MKQTTQTSVCGGKEARFLHSASSGHPADSDRRAAEDHTAAKTLAYINLYAVLGGLVKLCDTVPEAKKILGKTGTSIGFSIKGGPEATFVFLNGKCLIKPGVEECAIKIPFSSPEKFNGMIDGKVTPIPSKGFTKIGFLLGKFTKLTDLLTRYLRPSEADLADPVFFETSTRLMFHVIAGAVCQIANHDPIGMASAGYIVDGAIKMEICAPEGSRGETAALIAKNHRLTYSSAVPKKIMSYMQFADIQTARDLFDGKINSVASIGTGKVRMGGMISQIDNVNRILSRVELYLK